MPLCNPIMDKVLLCHWAVQNLDFFSLAYRGAGTHLQMSDLQRNRTTSSKTNRTKISRFSSLPASSQHFSQAEITAGDTRLSFSQTHLGRKWALDLSIPIHNLCCTYILAMENMLHLYSNVGQFGHSAVPVYRLPTAHALADSITPPMRLLSNSRKGKKKCQAKKGKG